MALFYIFVSLLSDYPCPYPPNVLMYILKCTFCLSQGPDQTHSTKHLGVQYKCHCHVLCDVIFKYDNCWCVHPKTRALRGKGYVSLLGQRKQLLFEPPKL